MLRFTNTSSKVILVLQNIKHKKMMGGRLVGGLGQGG